MDLDLDTLAALEAAAPASVAADGTKPHLVAAAKFYRAWKEAAPALIAAAREREGLPRLAWHNDAARVVAEREALAAENATAWEQAGQDRAKLNEVLLAYHALARAVRAQASAMGIPVSADVARLLEEVGDGE